MNLQGNISTLTLVFRTGFKDTSFRVCQTGGVQNFWKTVCSAAFLNVPANIFFCTFFLAVGNLDNSKLSWQAWDCRRTAPCWDPLFEPQVYFRVLRVLVCLEKKKICSCTFTSTIKPAFELIFSSHNGYFSKIIVWTEHNHILSLRYITSISGLLAFLIPELWKLLGKMISSMTPLLKGKAVLLLQTFPC